MDLIEYLIAMIIWFVIGTAFGAIVAPDPEILANSPELRQCLSQSGTTWQWGECVIILKN